MTVLLIILAGMFCLYLFLIAPRVPRRPLGPFKGPYAHRGLWDGQKPENSLPAFRAAVQKGFGVETDVHITADDRLVVFHDDSLKRMCGADRNIADCTLKELRQYTLLDTEENIPTFDEFLDTAQGMVPLLIEIKTDKRVLQLCRMVNDRLRSYPGPYMIESFDPRAVRWYRKNRPDVIRGQLTFGLGRPSPLPKTAVTRLLASQAANVIGRPDFIAADHTTDRRLPQFLVRLFRPHLAAWTVRSREDMRRLAGRYDIQIFEGFVPDAGDCPRNGTRR